jgi:hypothetical protein
MMKNKYDEVSKEYWTLLARQEAVETAQKNLNYIELDKPVHRGWNAEYVLRDDVARREDAWLFNALLANCGSKVWCKDKSFKRKIHKGKEEILKPSFGRIYESEWKTFIPAAQKYFTVSTNPDDHPCSWRGRIYYCNLPWWYFTIKITKHYVTHYQEHDEILEQEEAWVENKLRDPKFLKFRGKGWGNNWTAPKWYRKKQNSNRRIQHKNQIHRFIREGKEPTFNDNYKDGNWYW